MLAYSDIDRNNVTLTSTCGRVIGELHGHFVSPNRYVPYATGCDVTSSLCCDVRLGGSVSTEAEAFSILNMRAPIGQSVNCSAVVKANAPSMGFLPVCLLENQVEAHGADKEFAGFIMICIVYGFIAVAFFNASVALAWVGIVYTMDWCYLKMHPNDGAPMPPVVTDPLSFA